VSPILHELMLIPLLLLCGALQEFSGFTVGDVLIKLPFLTAFFLYIALTRPPRYVVAAAVITGLLIDIPGGLPVLCTMSFNLIIWLFWLAVRRELQIGLSAIGGMLVCMTTTVFQTFWIRLWLIGPDWHVFQRIVPAAGAGAFAGLTLFLFLAAIDSLPRENAVSSEGEMREFKT